MAFEGMVLSALVTANIVIAGDADYIILAHREFQDAPTQCSVVYEWPPESEFRYREKAGSWYAVWTAEGAWITHSHDKEGRIVKCVE